MTKKRPSTKRDRLPKIDSNGIEEFLVTAEQGATLAFEAFINELPPHSTIGKLYASRNKAREALFAYRLQRK